MAYISREEYKKRKAAKSRRRTIKPMAVAGIVLAVAVVALVVAILAGRGESVHLPENVRIQGVDVSGMERSQAIKLLKESFSYDDQGSGIARVTFDGRSEDIDFSRLQLVYDAEGAVDKAAAGSANSDYQMDLTINNDTFSDIAQSIYDQTYRAPAAETFEFDESAPRATITAGRVGREADIDALKADLMRMMQSAAPGTVELQFKDVPYDKLEVDPIYNQVYVEPVESEYYREGDSILCKPSKTGREIIKAEIFVGMNNVRSGGQSTYDLEITPLEPEHSQAELQASLFKDKLYSYTTEYSSYGENADRAFNIGHACGFINGTTLLHGEIFSFNDTVGPRTVERGFKDAHAFVDGRVVDEVGGGICQACTCIFNAFLGSGKVGHMKEDLTTSENDLDFAIRRYAHMFTVSYVDRGLDATVDYGSHTDFKVRNDTFYPVKIVTSVADSSSWGKKKLTVTVYGTDKREPGVTYVYKGVDTSSTQKPATKYTPDDSVPMYSEPVLKSTGYVGYTTTTYRYKVINGEVSAKGDPIYWSEYRAKEDEYLVFRGWTENFTPTPVPTAVPTPVPTPTPTAPPVEHTPPPVVEETPPPSSEG